MAILDNLGPLRRRLLWLFGPRRQVERENSPLGERPDRSFRPELLSLLLLDRLRPQRRVCCAILSDRSLFVIISLLHLDIFIPSSSSLAM